MAAFKVVLSSQVPAGFLLPEEVCISLLFDKVAIFDVLLGVIVQLQGGLLGKGGISLGNKSQFSEGLATLTWVELAPGICTWEGQGAHASH